MAENVRRVIEVDIKQSAAAAAAVREMQRNLKELEDAAKKAKSGLKDAFGGKIGFDLAGIGLIRQGITSVIDGVKELSGVNIYRSIAEIQSGLERLRLGFATATSGGLAGAAREIEYVRNTTREMGIEFGSAAQAFVRLSASAKGTSLEGQKTRDIFEAISLASRNLGLSTYQTENAFRALEQIISKGVVQQEELRGQLSEAIPGAVQIAARAFNMTTSELNNFIKTGEAFADDFVPKFIAQIKKEFGGTLPEGINTATLALNRFKSSYEQFLQEITDSGLGRAAANQLSTIATLFDDITDSIRNSKKESTGFIDFIKNLGRAAVEFEKVNQQRKDYIELAELVTKRDSGGFKDDTAVVQKRMAARIQFLEERIAARKKELADREAEADKGKPGKPTASENFRKGEYDEQAAGINRLRILLDKLKEKYDDKDAIEKRDLENLKRIRDAGLLNEEGYKRLAFLVGESNKSKSDAQRESEKEVTTAERMLERIREQIAVQKDLYTGEEASREVLRNRAALEEELAKTGDKRAKSILEVAKAENERLKTETQSANLRKAVLDTNKEIARDSEKRIGQLIKEAEQDEILAESSGKKSEKLRDVAKALIEAELAEARLSRTEAIRDQEGPERLAYWDRYIAALERAGKAKDKLSDAENNKFFDDVLKKDDENQKEKFVKESNDLRDAIVNNFRESKDIGKAITESIQDHLEKKLFKAIIEPELDILVDTLKQGVDMFIKYLLEEWLKARTVMAQSAGSGSGSFWNAILNMIGIGGSGTSSGTSPNTGWGGGNTGSQFVYAGSYAVGGRIPPGGWGWVGENGPERAYVSAKGTTIVPSGGPTIQGGGGDGGLTVNIINAPEGTTASERKTPNGRVLDVFIAQAKDAVAADIASGGRVAGAMQSTFGLNRSTPRVGF